MTSSDFECAVAHGPDGAEVAGVAASVEHPLWREEPSLPAGTAGEDVGASQLTPTQALTETFGTVALAAESAGAGMMAQGPGVGARGEMRHGFKIGGLRMMIQYGDSSELSEMPSMRRLPNSPIWFRGVANLRGKLIPVFDLASFLGLVHAGQGRKMLLVLGHGADAIGVIVDGLLERLKLSEDKSNLDAAPARLTRHLRSASLINEQVWYDLETRSLLEDLEKSLGAAG